MWGLLAAARHGEATAVQAVPLTSRQPPALPALVGGVPSHDVPDKAAVARPSRCAEPGSLHQLRAEQVGELRTETVRPAAISPLLMPLISCPAKKLEEERRLCHHGVVHTLDGLRPGTSSTPSSNVAASRPSAESAAARPTSSNIGSRRWLRQRCAWRGAMARPGLHIAH